MDDAGMCTVKPVLFTQQIEFSNEFVQWRSRCIEVSRPHRQARVPLLKIEGELGSILDYWNPAHEHQNS